MEKRTTLALVLSFVVLLFWSWLFPPPKPNNLAKVQPIVNKEVTQNSSTSDFKKTSPAPQIPSLEGSDEKLEYLTNQKISVAVSNIGAQLKDLEITQYHHKLPIDQVLSLGEFQHVPFELTEKSAQKLTYQFQSNDILVIKSFELIDNEYTLMAKVQITNLSEMSKVMDLKLKAYSLDISRVDNSNRLTSTLWESSVLSGNFVERKRTHGKFNKSFYVYEPKEIRWVGFRDQYYCAIIQPLFKTTHFHTNPVNEKVLELHLSSEGITLAPQQSLPLEALIYIGPQDWKILRSFKDDFENIIDYRIGNFFDVMAFGLTDVIAKFMFTFLVLIHKLLPNWGLCIIVFAFAIFVVTYPFTRASMVAMKKMQVLQPKIVKLREQYKNNPQKLNEELVGLYKKNKANPFGGCLPVLLQMPIFVSLYQLLWRSYVFKGADFLWIKDLSEPDRLFILPFSLPFLGNEFNLLPILYAILMFIQQKVSSKSMVYADQQQAEMQKMMMHIMPIMLGFLFYKFASGLCLYFTVYFLFSTIAQWKLKINMQEAEDA